jgi:uncharacterized ferritin-like protein (DUF455 family)
MSDIGNSLRVQEIRRRAYAALACADAALKADAARALLSVEFAHFAPETQAEASIPGRPARPELVSPRALAHRSLGTPEGRATLVHAVTHIEFNAINLALDVVSRFPDTPDEFVMDWARVASEEALHFSLLHAHLKHLGYDYGDFPAHDGLWEMAEKTQEDLLARLALVPRTLEARGLDVSPAMRDKFAQAGDMRAAEILDIILRDEIGHVAIGNKWFRFYCSERGIDPLVAFDRLSAQFDAPAPRGPFNVDARLRAGFVQEEIDRLIEKSKLSR